MAGVLLTAPLAGHAGPQAARNAMDACIEAFVSGNFPAAQPINVRKYNARPSPLESGLRTIHIRLDAKEKRTGREVARANCIADRNGVVLAMETERAQDSAIVTADAKSTRNR